MLIGILSDSHDNVANLRRALALFRQQGVTLLFHCGDMTSVATARELDGFQVHYVTGNMDLHPVQLRQALLRLHPDSSAAQSYAGTLANRRIAALHGHEYGKLAEFVENGRFDYVFHGHTHRRRDEIIGQTRVINPGALGGARHEPRSVCLLDLTSGAAQFLTINE